MKTYLVLSFILFVIAYLGIHIAKICLGGDTKVAPELSICLMVVVANTIIATIIAVIYALRGKL